jgi:hypothetical protein
MLTYAYADSGAHYVLEIKEGHIDQGADISSLSFYPKEKEKFYRPLSYMQVARAVYEALSY